MKKIWIYKEKIKRAIFTNMKIFANNYKNKWTSRKNELQFCNNFKKINAKITYLITYQLLLYKWKHPNTFKLKFLVATVNFQQCMLFSI